MHAQRVNNIIIIVSACVTDETDLRERDHINVYEKLQFHAARWRDIGTSLGFSQGELDNIQATPLLLSAAPKSWLSAMLAEWLQWAPGDGHGRTGFATVKSLSDALLHAGLGRTAEEFKSVYTRKQ